MQVVLRSWMALALLAAVFGMHGMQCTSATDLGTATSADSAAVTHSGLTATAAGVPAAPQAFSAGDAMVTSAEPAPATGISAMPSIPVARSAPGSADHGTGHDAAGHLWTVCLAVLAAGLAVLLAVGAARLLRLLSPALRATWAPAVGFLPLARPPDLHVLCLLRQ